MDIGADLTSGCYRYCHYVAVVAQSPTHVQLLATPWTAACQASLPLTITRSLPKFMFFASVMPFSHLILWSPLLFLPQSFPASDTFPMSQLFASGDQNTGASASASVLPMGNQPRILIGRTDAEAESPILWSPDANSWLIGKDLDAGKDWRQEEKGWQRIR